MFLRAGRCFFRLRRSIPLRGFSAKFLVNRLNANYNSPGVALKNLMKINYLIFLFCLLFILTAGGFAQESESGYGLYERGEYEKAIEVLQKSAAAEKDRKSLLFLGMSFLKLNKNKEAVEVFEKAAVLPSKEPVDGENAARFVYQPRPNYTQEARRKGVAGRVKLAVEFGADGEVKQIFPFKELEGGLTGNAIAAARSIRFEPATKNGKPVLSMAVVIYTFEIR